MMGMMQESKVEGRRSGNATFDPLTANAIRRPGQALRLLTFVVCAALAVRVFFWFAYQPVSYSDTNSYRRTALAIQEDWNVDGTRTPGYPVFLLLFRPDADGWEQRAWLGQMALGVVVTGLMFFLGWLVTGKTWAGVIMGLAYSLNLQQVFFECNLITEALTTFFLTLTLAGMALWLYRPSSRSILLAFGIGLAAALTAIVRPLFIFLPVWILFFLIWKVEEPALGVSKGQKSNVRLLTFDSSTANAIRRSGQALRLAFPILIPSLLILGGWVWFIHEAYGNWSMTTMGGYHMIQHTGEYFEYVPDEYATLRDIYIQYRDAKVAATGTPTNAIWEAIPEMTKASGIGFYDLSDKLTEISMQLIRQHPDLFLKNAIEGWWMFWRAPVYWSADALRWPALAVPLRGLIFVERIVLFAANMAFIGLSLWALGGMAFRMLSRRSKVEGQGIPLKFAWRRWTFDPSTANAIRRPGQALRLFGKPWASFSPFPLFLASAIWVCSIFQTLLDHGDNPRFLVPLQTAVILWLVVTFGTSKVKSRRSKI